MEKLINELVKNPFDYANKLKQEDLEKIILHASDKYYNDHPVINDAIFDMLRDFLAFKFPKSKVLKEIGAPIKSKDKVKLPYHLGSMDKIKPPSQHLDTFIKKYKPPYFATEKLDGMSGLIVYTNDGKINFYSRGKEREGLNLNPILKYIPNILNYEEMEKRCKKLKIKGKDNLIAIRGELIMQEDTFEKNWKGDKKNSRNTVAGLINSVKKNINPKLAGDCNFVVYEMVDPFYNFGKQLDLISKLDFNKVHNKVFEEISFEILSKYFKKRREKSKYMIDGIIITNNDDHQRNTNGNPKYAFAFKDILEDQKAITKVIDVEWNISKDGYVKPTLILNPVDIGGVTIQRVTANNAKFIKSNSIGKGTIIEIIRSGDVIPMVNKIIKKSTKPDMPDLNPSDWKWSDTKVDIILTKSTRNSDIKSIYHFFSTLNVKGLGEKNVEKFYDSGFTSIESIINMSVNDIKTIEGFKDKSANNIYTSIRDSLKDINLPVLFKASNLIGRGIGYEKTKLIIDTYPDFLKLYEKKNSKEIFTMIMNIPGWDEKTVKLFLKNLPGFIKFYKNIESFITFKKIKVVKSNLTDKVFVFTKFRDETLKLQLEEMGAKVTNSISSKTDYLVVKDKESLEEKQSKIIRAEELGVKIITKDELITLIKKN
jgi:DNA ligase (NAD+)